MAKGTDNVNPRLTTLCYIEKDGCYLILHRTKKQHDENGDKWIGVGGKFEYGESPEECALREVKEETGLTMLNPRFRGLVTFAAYAADKRAAKRGAWRTPESTLHTLELLCGWPGAWLAQRLLRHKSVKTSFRIVFFLMVVLNLAALAYVIYGMTSGDWSFSRR